MDRHGTQQSEQEIDEQRYVYGTAIERFNMECHYIKGLVLRYVRRHYARMLDERGNCAPVRPSAWEVLDIAGIERNKAGMEFLDNAGFPSLNDIEQQLQKVEAILCRRVQATNALGEPSVMRPEAIQSQFHLDDLDTRLLCAIAAPQISHDIARLYRFATGVDAAVFPVRFYCELLCTAQETSSDILERFAPDGCLRQHALISLGEQAEIRGMTPTLHAPVSVPNQIASFLNGVESKANVKYGFWVKNSQCKSPLTDATRKLLMKQARRPQARIGVFGPTGSGRSELIEEFAFTAKMQVLRIALYQIHIEETDIELINVMRQWFREVRLQNAILHFDCDGDIASHTWELLEHVSDELNALSQNHPGVIFITAAAPHPSLVRIFGKHAEIICPPPTQAQQVEFWHNALEGRIPDERLENVVSYVSSSYCLTPGEIDQTIEATLARTGGQPASLTGEQLCETLCASRGRGLEGLADLKPTPLGLDDIILSDNSRAVIDDILNFARYSELVRDDWGFARMSSASGLSVLFSGPPGTGKTLTAGVIAHELRRALYVVDISRVIDKYVGETEKRLAKIFDHAKKSQAILLFDEADSLFAKRTNVKSSNDRYANLEVNYLLQRLEAYRGVTILTTNLASSLDEALARRIQFKLEFPMPNANERAELWRVLLPKQAPKDDIDFDSLGHGFEMSGGHIKNAVFRACIGAAASGRPIDTEILWDAGMHEYRELGHIVRERNEDDDEYYPM